MPWIPVKHGLRKLRESRGMSLQDLEDESGVSIRSISAIESRKPPSFVKAQNAEAISLAFGLKLLDYNNWPATSRWIVWRPTRGSQERDADEPQLAGIDTLSKSAQIERKLGLHAQTVQTSAGAAALLGLDRLDKVMTLPKLHADQIFAVYGKVDEHIGLPSSAAKRIGAEEDEGAVFRVTRAVSKNLPIYVSVFSRNAEMSKRLLGAYDSGERVAMLVRVVYDPYKGPWRGFFFIEHGPPKAKKFAFVIEKLVALDDQLKSKTIAAAATRTGSSDPA